MLLDPGETVWVDLEVPRGDPSWHDDVGRAAWWLGDVWAAALGSLGVTGLSVHRGGLERRRWGALVCFASLGPGEVTAGPAGPKVVGISQRRVRAGARFQCAVPRRWDPARLAALLALAPGERRQLVDELAAAVQPVDLDADAVVGALIDALPT